MNNLSKVTGKYIDKTFSEYGCLDFVYYFLKDLGLNPPDRIGKWGIHNYEKFFEKDPKEAIKQMEIAFDKIGEEVKNPWIGDLLIMEQDGDIKFPAVYVGNRTAITSFSKYGVKPFKIDEYNRVIKIRRLNVQ